MVFGYTDIMQFLLATVAIVISIVLHELAHGYVALWNGDMTAKAYGRLSLNPLVHFDLYGLLMLVLVRFGYARPVPVNPYNFKRRRLGCITVSCAGILVNILLAFICTPLYFLCQIKGGRFLFYLGSFLFWMIIININLAVFNLLPIYPLDGYKIVEGFTRANNPFTRFMRVYGQYILIALIAVSVLVDSLGFPYWLDFLGLYIDTTRGAIITVLEKFWNLFF